MYPYWDKFGGSKKGVFQLVKVKNQGLKKVFKYGYGQYFGGRGEGWPGKNQTQNLERKTIIFEWNSHAQVSKHWPVLFLGSNIDYYFSFRC